MADTMMHFKDNGLETHFLTDEEIMNVCPNAFKTEPTNPKVSEKYVQATTIDVVRDMRALGWYPVQAKQCRPKKGSSGIRSFHMVCLQNPNIKIMNGDNVEAYPRIMLTTSHDGFCSFKFMVGLFRLVCSNGLVIADEEYANLSIRHINYTMEELKKTVAIAVDNLPNKIQMLNNMRNTVLTDEQREDFVVNAIKVKKGLSPEQNFTISKEEILDILEPIRDEDKGNTLWATFNVIQEKLIKGGYSLSNGKKSRRQRGITSIKKDIEINQNLYAIANSYVNLAA